MESSTWDEFFNDLFGTTKPKDPSGSVHLLGQKLDFVREGSTNVNGTAISLTPLTSHTLSMGPLSIPPEVMSILTNTPVEDLPTQQTTNKKGPTMQDTIKTLRKAVTRATEGRYEDGTIVRFTYWYEQADTQLTYAALWVTETKRWYLTSGTGRVPWGGTLAMTDEDFVELLSTPAVQDMQVAESWAEL